MLTPSQVEFGLIPREHWFQPDWIDEEKATKGRADMVEKGIIYGGSVPYRNMCRFSSGVSCFHGYITLYSPSSKVLFPASFVGEIPLVLAHRVGRNFWYQFSVGHDSSWADQMSTSTATFSMTHSLSWKHTIKHIVCPRSHLLNVV